MNDAASQLETLRQRIQDGERGDSEEDRELLLAFSDRIDLLQNEYTDHRHLKLLRHLTRISEHAGNLADALEDQEAAEDIVRWINRNYENPNTNRDFKSALRVFAHRVTDGDETPDSVAWISTTLPRNYDPTPDPADMLTLDEAQAMAEAARNARDKALIMLAFDAGPRPGELYDLKVGDVNDLDDGWAIRVDGKTGQRTVFLNLAVPHLTRWLDDHPSPRDPSAPLWTKQREAERPSYTYFLRIFKQAADRAGVEKTVTPRNFRRSNATFLARRGANEALINNRQGRQPGSEVTAHYVAMMDGDQARQYAKLMGDEPDEDPSEDVAPPECPRCHQKTPRDRPRCVFCGQILDEVALEEQREMEREIRTDLMEGLAGDPDRMKSAALVREIVDSVDGDPEALETLKDALEAAGD